MYDFKLWFFNQEDPQLVRTEFVTDRTKRVCVRGRTQGAHHNCGTFLWTNGVRALALLCIRAAYLGQQAILLEGERGSLAASLDYALTKEPLWVHDLIGTDVSGRPLLRSLLSRTNSNRKRCGPVSFSLSKSSRDARIVIYWDNRQITNESEVVALETLIQLPENKKTERKLAPIPEEFQLQEVA